MPDYNYVDPMYLHHHPSSSPPPPLSDYHHHFQHNTDVERTTTAGVGVSSWGDDDDHYYEKKAVAGTLESLVDQATRFVSTSPVSTATTYHGDNIIKMINDDISSTGWTFGGNYNPQQIITATSNSVYDNFTSTTTTMAVKNHHHQFVQVPDNINGVVLMNNNTYGSEIEHRNGKEKEEEEIYGVNNEAAKMDNYNSNDGWMTTVHSHHDNPASYASLLTYATATSTTRSAVPDNHAQSKESKKVEKHNSTTSTGTNKRSKATIIHNKVEHKRRYKINQKMEALQRLVPNICCKVGFQLMLTTAKTRCDHDTDLARDPFSKNILKTRVTDKATILDQVIEYIKKLQNQRDQLMMMSSYGMNNNMTYPMMIPMPYAYYMYMQQQQQQQQQQLRMSMITGAQMGMGADLGSMHTNPIMHPNSQHEYYWN